MDNPLEQLRKMMDEAPFEDKARLWLNTQLWMLYCLITNNRICRYFKYKNLENNERKTYNLSRRIRLYWFFQ